MFHERAFTAAVPALDQRQAEAVGAPPGPLLILAGAGSGKTRVLTERAVALARAPGVGPPAVLVITFTNRAAKELRGRLAALIGDAGAEQMTIGTFHAVCHRLLRTHARHVGRSAGFSVYDTQASRKLIDSALEQVGALELTVRQVADQIGRAKARLVDAEGYRSLAQSPHALLVADAFARYEALLERSDALDFDDLLVRAVELLGRPGIATALRRRWRALLVDEYQDTNPAQDEWLRRLAGERANVTVVGDPGQAIYGFRGAELGNILGFERRFAGNTVIALERNYRSSAAIVACAARLAGHGDFGRRLMMWTDAEAGPAVAAVACADEREEAQQAALWCRALLDRGKPAGELAVLFRTRAQAHVLEDALLGAGVACRVLGGQGLWESAAVRDLVAHLTLLANPRDRLALARALRCQPGLGAMAVARVLGAAEARGADLVETCAAAAAIPKLGGRQQLAVEAFGRELAARGGRLRERGIATTAVDIVIALGLAERLRTERTERSQEQLERLRRFCRAARGYERESESPRLAEFLAHGALAAGEEELDGGERVTLATLHGAKGAEWDHVRLVGLCEGLLPHRRALERDQLGEERRLAYVGMTRARKELALSWPRTHNGAPMRVSRFVAEAGLSGRAPVRWDAQAA